MLACNVENLGEAPSLKQVEKPNGKDLVIIKVKYAGMNPADYKTVDKLNVSSKFPFTLGVDFSGVIECIPAGYSKYCVGDRVFGMARSRGSYAEYVGLATDSTSDSFTIIPNAVTDAQAAALPIPGAAAIHGLELLQIKSGMKIAIMGATGSVGRIALQLALKKGVDVIASVRSSKAEALSLGASKVFDSSVNVFEAIKESYPEGIDGVFDLVHNAKQIQRNAEILKPGGRLVSATYAADEKWFSERGIFSENISGKTNPFGSETGLRELMSLLAAGAFNLGTLQEIPLTESANTLSDLKSGKIRGKFLIRMES